MDAAILFEAEAYRLDGPKLMGRQAAGNGFLRAAVKAQAGRTIWGFSPYSDSQAAFRRTVLEIDPAASVAWIPRRDLKAHADRGVLFRPDGEIAQMAWQRLRTGPASYSLCGLTHTLSGKPVVSFAESMTAPLAPWDAVICTSTAARGVLEQVFGAQADYLAWRLGAPVRPPLPQLPVIPLGVHADDFRFSADDRARARALLGLADDEVAILFPGRLTFHAKAHPFQTFVGIQAAAKATGKRVVLMLAGQAPNIEVETAYLRGLADFCPDVRSFLVNGKDFARYGATWAAADIFCSLSDNIQETFGITPVEAMASGLPVLVSDWDGYRDTVRDGVDGFRIPTTAPAAGRGEHIAQEFETGVLNYDYMLFRTCLAVSVDAEILADRLTRLIGDPELRRTLGAAGQARARETYDWPRVYARYQTLWDELTAIRKREAAANAAHWSRAPRQGAGREDPFRIFGGFPTRTIDADTPLVAIVDQGARRYAELEAHPLFPHWKVAPEVTEPMFARLERGPATPAELAAAARIGVDIAVEVAARFVKMNLLRLG